ncbi:PAAR-like domain-containing protein [Sorangium sp. So ce1504]|uniref:PAAR-like domain-containing protein n=1 Tax=Sorangium sp. So ce1504 TaxID=3133337 RepID=UPI003F60AE80
MAKVTALGMDTITEKSGHQMTGMAVSVCLTPAAPSPLPIPYPTMGTVAEGIIDPCMRTKIEGAKILTVGGCMKACHGNEPGTLKEVVSLNTGGPCFPWLGAPNVLIELGMAGITGSMGQMNKSITVGAGASASGAGGGGGGGGSGGGGAGGPGGGRPQGGSNGGGAGGGSSQGAGPPRPPAPPGAEGQASGGHPVDVVTGTMFTHPTIDFSMPGCLSTQMTRRYRSSAVRHKVGLGWGWSHGFSWQATRAGDRVVLVDPDFREVPLALRGEDEVVALPFGVQVRFVGDDIVVALNDGYFRVLRRAAGSPVYRLAALRDETGNAIECVWEAGELVALLDSAGRRATLRRDGSYRSWIQSVAGEDGKTHERRLVTYEIDARGDLVRVIDAGGVETSYAYDEQHYLVSESLPDGTVYRFLYADHAGQRRCVETWGELQGGDILGSLGARSAGSPVQARGLFHARFDYGPGPSETRMIDAAGGAHRYRGNALGLVEEYVDPRGYCWTYRYDEAGRLISMSDGGGRVERRSFDLHGRMLGLIRPDGARWAWKRDDEQSKVVSVDAAGKREIETTCGTRTVEHQDARGRITRFAYDAHGLLRDIAYPDGTVETRSYDAHGNINEHTFEDGSRARYTFDLFGRPVWIRTPRGAEYELGYDSRGDLVFIAEPGDKTTEFRIGPTRLIEAMRDPSGEVTRYRHVAGALVECVRADGTRYAFGYDALRRLVWIENPAGERYQRTYDAAGNIVRETSFAGVTTEYAYDGSRQLVSVTRADGAWIHLLRDAEGRIVAREHSTGLVERFTYGAGGALTAAESQGVRVQFERDEDGRILREIQEAGGWRFEIGTEYDNNGGVLGKAYSTGWSVSFIRRPGDGVPLALRAVATTPEELRFEYDDRGVETLRRRATGPGAIATESDAYGLPTRVSVLGEDEAMLRERRYEWAVDGPLRRVVDTHAGQRRYELDPLGRPLAAEGLGAAEHFHYAPHGTPVPRAQPWAIGRGGRPTNAGDVRVAWDALGRLAAQNTPDPLRSWAYTYDENDRLIEARRGDGRSVRYLYDPFGRRLAETYDDGESTWFGWDVDSPVEERSTKGGVVRRVFRDDGYVPLLEAEDGRAFRMIATDAAGTPWLYVDPSHDCDEIDLSAWGTVARRSGQPGGLRFAGQREDAFTGLHYNHHRHYAPALHVFLTPDPLGIDVTLNDVGFVPNVTLYIDPLGLTTIVVGAPHDPTIKSHAKLLRKQYPGAKVISSDQLGKPPSLWQKLRGKNNKIDPNENHVVVTTHGAPGSAQWGNGSASGEQIGDMLKNAGFQGGPGAVVDVSACNAATPAAGQKSIAHGIASSTGANANGAMRDPSVDPNQVHNYQGKKPSWKFWGKPPQYPYRPGEMCPTPQGPFVHQGYYVGVTPSGSVSGVPFKP